MWQKNKRVDSPNKCSRVLIMGGLGFIGSHLCRNLLKEGYKVRIFDKLYTSRKLIKDILDEVEIDEGDAGKPEDVIRSLKGIDIAIHLIHTTVPGSSMQNPAYDVQSNVTSSAKWLPLLKHTDLARIIYISSGGTVYGRPVNNPVSEHHQNEPICSYGITKLAIEKYISMYANLNNIEYRICRPSNVYGEGQHLNIGQGVIGVFLEHALKGHPIDIWGDGTITRDYIYVKDMICGVIKLIKHEGKGRIFNISTGVGHSLNDIISIIRDELKLTLKVKYKTSRGFDVPVNILDNTRVKCETGWEPKTNIIDGIRYVYEWLKDS